MSVITQTTTTQVVGPTVTITAPTSTVTSAITTSTSTATFTLTVVPTTLSDPNYRVLDRERPIHANHFYETKLRRERDSYRGDGDDLGPKKDEIIQRGSTGCLTHTGRCCGNRSNERNLVTECGEYGVGG